MAGRDSWAERVYSRVMNRTTGILQPGKELFQGENGACILSASGFSIPPDKAVGTGSVQMMRQPSGLSLNY